MVHGVTVRAIGAFTDEELDFRPRPAMRTPRELIFHIYAQEKLLAEAAQQGRFTVEAANRSNPEDEANGSALDSLTTVRDARAYAEACHEAAEKIFRTTAPRKGTANAVRLRSSRSVRNGRAQHLITDARMRNLKESPYTATVW